MIVTALAVASLATQFVAAGPQEKKEPPVDSVARVVIVASNRTESLAKIKETRVFAELESQAKAQKFIYLKRGPTVFIIDEIVCQPEHLIGYSVVLDKFSPSNQVFAINIGELSPEARSPLLALMAETGWGGLLARKVLSRSEAKLLIRPAYVFTVTSGGIPVSFSFDHEPDKLADFVTPGISYGAIEELLQKPEEAKNDPNLDLTYKNTNLVFEVRSFGNGDSSRRRFTKLCLEEIEREVKVCAAKLDEVRNAKLNDAFASLFGAKSPSQLKLSDLQEPLRSRFISNFGAAFADMGFGSRSKARNFLADAELKLNHARLEIGFGINQSDQPGSTQRWTFGNIGGYPSTGGHS